MKAREIAELVDGELIGEGDVEITRAAELSVAGSGDLAFISSVNNSTVETGASCILVPESYASNYIPCMIKVRDPKLAFARAAHQLHPRKRRSGIHPSAVLEASSEVHAAFVGAFASVGGGCFIGNDVEVHEGVRIDENVTIGDRTVLHANVVISDNTVIGDDCVIHAGTVIGADGFGYVPDESGERVKFPQIGTVVIEDNVEIGANSCVDRGALGETRIGKGTKIDNLVQIAHNVSIGKRCVIAALTGISGSVVIEDDCVLGGQVGVADHVHIKKGAVIGARSAIFPGKIVGPGVWAGSPIQPLDKYKRQNARMKGLDRLADEVKRLAALLASKDR